jgi:putative FmdB family regulatory protein
MPIYEYEPEDRDCLMCEGRIAILQSVDDESARYCPHCGLEISRVISKASIRLAKDVSAEQAAKMGFTTYRKLESGVFEKVGGEGDETLKVD